MDILHSAWQQYRGWAAQSRHKKASSLRWNRIAFWAAVTAAICGAVSSQLPANGGILTIIAAIAAFGSALYAWIGKEGIASESENIWVKARAAAEGIRSECYRYAAGAAGYDGTRNGAMANFTTRIETLTKSAVEAGVVPINIADVPPPDRPVPPVPMTADWYLQNRIRDQRAFFEKDMHESEKHIRWLSVASGVTTIAAAVIGALALKGTSIAAWVGVVTTVVATYTALAHAGRNKMVMEKAGMMINRLNQIELKHSAGALSLPDLVVETEALMQAENALWIQLMDADSPRQQQVDGGSA